MKHIKLFEHFSLLENIAIRGQKPTTSELSNWKKSFNEWSEGKVPVAYSNVLEFFQNNNEDAIYQENIEDLLEYLKEGTLTESIKKIKLSDEDTKLLAKDFTVDGKYAFDEKLTDKEKEALLKLKVEDIIKQKKLNPAEATRVRTEWHSNLQKVGVGQFEDELKKRWLSADRKLTGGRLTTVTNKIKNELWKGYKSPVAEPFNSLADIITGSY